MGGSDTKQRFAAYGRNVLAGTEHATWVMGILRSVKAWLFPGLPTGSELLVNFTAAFFKAG